MTRTITGITIHYEENGEHTEQHVDPSGIHGIAITEEAVDAWREAGLDVEERELSDIEQLSRPHGSGPPHAFGSPTVMWGLCIYDPHTGRIICVADPAGARDATA